MAEKLILCVHTERGTYQEWGEHVVNDAALMERIGYIPVKVEKEPAKDVIEHIKEATTVEQVEEFIKNEDRKSVLDYAKKKIQSLNK